MIINGIDFEVIINVKKIKRIYLNIKLIDNKYYMTINSYKKLSDLEIQKLIEKNPKVFERLILSANKIKINSDQIMILGKQFKRENSEKLIEEAYNKIISLYNKYQIIFNRNNTTLKFRKMKTRWGVCHINKNYICLTSYLVHVPLELVEYVIIHEFCHFQYPNHSKQFYKCVSKYCSDYKNRIKQLKNFSFLMN